MFSLLNTSKVSILSRFPRLPPQSDLDLHLAPPFLVEDYIPNCVTTLTSARKAALKDEALGHLSACRLCAHDCNVDRLRGSKGVCNVGRKAVVSAAFPHFGEESVLQGWNGSGTIFFGLCNLRCVFCQNWDISQKKKGWEMDAKRIADIMIRLQNETKCHNVNFVTPEHVVPQVVEAIIEAVDLGFSLPIVYNTSSFDSEASLRMLDGLVDIYMPDFKFWSPETAHRLCKSRSYPKVARKAIKMMHEQVGDLVFDSGGLAKKGLLVRHLVMPGLVDEGKEIMRFLADEISKDTYVNVMDQYRPDFTVGKGEKRARLGVTKYEDIDRPVRAEETVAVVEHAKKCGLWRFEE